MDDIEHLIDSILGMTSKGDCNDTDASEKCDELKREVQVDCAPF